MAETHSHLLIDRSDGVLTLTMNRPDARNSLSPQAVSMPPKVEH